MPHVPILARALFFCALVLSLPVNAASENHGDSLREQVRQFDRELAGLRALHESIESAPEPDREALVYRQDDRSFKLLALLAQLARDTAELAADDPVRLEIHAHIEAGLEGAGTGVLKRIGELGERIAALQVETDNAAGASLLAIEARQQSLENLRFRYYDSLVDVIEGKRLLGMPAGGLEQRLLRILYLHAETLVGRLQFNGGTLDELRVRQAEDSGNADLATAATETARRQEIALGHLEAMIDLLERLDEDSAAYEAAVLQQRQGLSVAVLHTGVLMGLLEEGWAALRQATVERGPDLLFQLLVFVLILLVFRYLSRLTRGLVRAACERPGVDMSTLLKDVLVSVCGGTVMVFGILIALAQVGISLGPMLAGLGVAGFIVGFALQDTLGNFAAGGMILIYRPYDVDDYVEVAGAAGLVKKMSLVSTTIATFDNQTLVVPNSKIWGDVIKNVTAQKVRRVDLLFGIGYGDDIALAERVLAQVLEDNEMVLGSPEAMIRVHELGDSSVNIAVRPWVKTEDYWEAYWSITREVKLRFDREGISIPFPQRDVHFFPEQGEGA